MKLKNKIILPLTSLTTTSILFVALSTVSQASADEREVNQSTNEQGLNSFQKVNIKTQNQNSKPENLSNPSNSEQQSPNTDSKNVKQSSNLNIQDSKDEDNASNLEQRDTNNDAKVTNQLANSDEPEDNAKSENKNQSSDFVEQDSNVESQKQNNVSEDEQSNSNDASQKQDSAAEDEQSDSNDTSQRQNSDAEDKQSISNNTSENKNEVAKEDNYTPTIPKGNQGVVKKNKYPIILAHGFSVYPDESKPAVLPSYWGGNKVDLDKELNKQGYDVREGGMSPFGSNYDRALELYYYIKGGTVDYGAYHSKKYGHARYGKTYKGIYPEWAPGKKVHLVGHSFGGQTIQVLEDMLRNGVPEEIEYQKKHGGDIPEIFAGGNNNMVSSVTTIATPHNGTFISDKLGNKPIARKLFYNILKYTSNKYTKADYGHEPWGIKQRDDESYIQYLKRVKDNKVWKTEDTSFTDGSIEGSKKINDRLTLSKDVAYTSITAEDTHKTFNNRQRGNFKMFAPFKLLANLVGRQNPESWREGDGPVPLKSGLYPFNKPHKDTTFDSKPELGLWGVMPTLKNWDHMDLVGWDLTDTRIKPKMVLGLYEQLANYLAEVEKVQESSK
ncbi:lipase [Staphylococcus xylosus]|uniref:lipase-like domain-containing protein n=1 Tax=Staphylococcus xylosus TaxID=1288 RepID=UPI00203B22C2|nr:lipase [Staphylococcus xylosus]MCM3518753.1 lipase [Staphylococcus xylosus]